MTTTSLAAALIPKHLPKEGGLLDASWCALTPDLNWADVSEAIARCACAPEQSICERPIAFFSMEENYPEIFNGFLLFTDRRMFGRWPTISASFVDVHLRYSWIQGVQRIKKMLSDKLQVMHANQTIELNFGIFNDQLEPFLNELIAYPPEQREPPQVPLVQPSEQDPAGAGFAISAMMDLDPRASFLFNYLGRACQTGQIPANVAADLVARVSLQHRDESGGRGVYDGSWMSPLTRDDLSHAFVQIFGQQLFHQEESYRTLTFDAAVKYEPRDDFDRLLDGVDSVMSKVDKVADGLDVAADVMSLNVGGLAGRAAGAMFGPKTINQFTVTIVDSGTFSSFRLFSGQAPLSSAAPELVDEILWNLELLEASVLLRRCVYGWDAPFESLLGASPQEMHQRFTAIAGQLDARSLSRRQPMHRNPRQ